jgi:hypothetical protein
MGVQAASAPAAKTEASESAKVLLSLYCSFFSFISVIFSDLLLIIICPVALFAVKWRQNSQSRRARHVGSFNNYTTSHVQKKA